MWSKECELSIKVATLLCWGGALSLLACDQKARSGQATNNSARSPTVQSPAVQPQAVQSSAVETDPSGQKDKALSGNAATATPGAEGSGSAPVAGQETDVTEERPSSKAQTAATRTTDEQAQKGDSPAEPSQEEPVGRRYVVAALGDSLTDSRSGGGGYLDVLRRACPESSFINFGKGGDMTNQMRRRMEAEILPQRDSLGLNTLLVYGGVNDLYSDLTAGRTNDRIEEDLEGIYVDARRAGLRVVAITVSPWGGFSKYYNERRGQNTQLLNSWILSRVAKGSVDVVMDSHPLLSCGPFLCPEYRGSFADGLHFGKEGHQVLGEKLHQSAFPDCR